MRLIKNFNTKSLLHFTEDDRVLSAQLLSMALKDIPGFFSSASDLIRKKRYHEAAVWIHKIKGIAGTVGAELLYDLCLSTEEILKESNPATDSDKLISTMAESIDEFCRNSDVQEWVSDV
ncbi:MULTISPECIES: Hpt domain-containing protein [unclassified Oceanispirochaeta]|uniref:Hpt domain-containing protein n=1 Tax=unclassified Oceanispirochaeta TaxID=2635722 RepID=UPI000E09621B|nr:MULTISPECIES: Hpt domain-containing protein [unclassified Oceanispirochaeta]MBF9015641.1 Hpt domain-containing protein [Oceanispirochaeta sp. M2]NPD73415.1 Hpt domain-containing protein [Oceanispirochaeta sp. M1]RDG30889.1 hypothetical protein DV872_15035 [Oceanispirochaeta sp. M1]